MADSCATCRFSAPSKNAGKLDCRRRPPVDIARHNAAEFPAVFSHSWCGEFEAKPTSTQRKKRPAAGETEKRPASGERESREQG